MGTRQVEIITLSARQKRSVCLWQYLMHNQLNKASLLTSPYFSIFIGVPRFLYDINYVDLLC